MTPQLHRPETLDEVCALLATLDGAMVYGGGTAIQILIKQGLLFADHLVDISKVSGLDTIHQTATGIRVGSMVTVRRMELDPLVRRQVPLAAQTYRCVANPRVRNTASVGGNIAHGDYRLDPPTALLVLGASVQLTSDRGTRTVAAADFFLDLQTTAVEEGELVVAIDIPSSDREAGCAYVKMSSLGANDWPAASVAALVDPGRSTIRLGLGALAPIPRSTVVDVRGLTLDQAVGASIEAATELMDPIPDVRGTAAYKRRLGIAATEQAVRRAWEDAA